MPTFSTSDPNAPVAVEYKTVTSSVADDILGVNIPDQHPYAPPVIGDPNRGCAPDSNTWEVYLIPCGSGPVSDFPVQMKVPRSMLLFRGNDQGGSFSGAYISFVPSGAVGGTVSKISQYSVGIGFQNFQFATTEGVAPVDSVIKLCKPITKFYITVADCGQPGSNHVIWATDDFDFLANSRQ